MIKRELIYKCLIRKQVFLPPMNFVYLLFNFHIYHVQNSHLWRIKISRYQ